VLLRAASPIEPSSFKFRSIENHVAEASLAAFFLRDFFAFVPLAPDAASALAVPEAAAAADAAFDFLGFLAFVVDAESAAAAVVAAVVAAGVVAGVVAVVAAGEVAAVAAVDDFTVDLAGVVLPAAFVAAFVPVGGAEEPPIVRPACSRFATDFVPSPLTRVARSSASLNGPFFVRSSTIAFDFTGPKPFTDSSAVWSAVLTSTAANAAPIDNVIASNSISSFFSMSCTPGDCRFEKSSRAASARRILAPFNAKE
jgi:hypothetical protein